MPYSEPGGGVLGRTDIEGSALVWLLEVELNGVTLRWSSRPVDVVTEAGASLHYPGGLDALTQEKRLTLFSDTGEAPEASFNNLPLFGVDLPSLIEGGALLSARPGELALWVEGTTYERRLVVVWGHTRGAEYGAPEEGVGFTLGERALDDAGVFPPAGAVVRAGGFSDEATAAGWTSGSHETPEESRGRSYPAVFGNPGGRGFDTTGGDQVYKGSPAIPIDYDTSVPKATILLLSYGWVASQYVTIHPMSGDARFGTPDTFAVALGTDNFGHPFSYVDISSKGTGFADAPEFWAAWPDVGGGIVPNTGPQYLTTNVTSNATGSNQSDWSFTVASSSGFAEGDVVYWVELDNGLANRAVITSISGTTWGIRNLDGPTATGPRTTDSDFIRVSQASEQAVNAAGEALHYMMSFSTKRWDVSRWQAIRQRANQFRIDACIREPVKPWAFVRRHLLKDFLPLSTHATFDGVAPVWWRYEAGPSEAVAHLHAAVADLPTSGFAVRTGPVEYQGELSDIANRITFGYQFTPRRGVAGRARTMQGRWDEGAEDSVTFGSQTLTFNIASLAASRSRALFGEREKRYDCAITADIATADAVLGWLAVRDGFNHRIVPYAVGKEYAHLDLGDVVTLTDDELGISDRVALVVGLSYSATPFLQVWLQLVTNPAVTSVATGPNPDDAEGEPGV